MNEDTPVTSADREAALAAQTSPQRPLPDGIVLSLDDDAPAESDSDRNYRIWLKGVNEARREATVNDVTVDERTGNVQQSAERLSLTWCENFQPQIEGNDFVEGVLCAGSLVVFYGDSGTFKTGIVTDISMHVATDRPWCGRAVDHGCIVYQVGEGGNMFPNRIIAHTRHSCLDAKSIPLAIMREQVNLLDRDADVDLIIKRIIEAGEKTKLPVRAFISDTLSRAIAGGNENDSADMGRLVMNADRIRAETGVCLIFVHHTGKDASRGARGHSLLRAATDTEIEVSRDESGVVMVRVTKQRDMECSGQFAFTALPVELGNNRRGKPVTSFVMVPSDTPTTKAAPVKMSAPCSIALAALSQAIQEAGQTPPANHYVPPGIKAVPVELWRKYAYAKAISDEGQDAKRKAFKRASEQLQARGIVAAWGEWVWPT